ncbi:hypothetical protein F5884DRAFT_798875 [Xylogone sp. PMI_703]|nr:hypothetical protein F5884DRAFT_798875 [Xylogone sp. PMI_703]
MMEGWNSHSHDNRRDHLELSLSPVSPPDYAVSRKPLAQSKTSESEIPLIRLSENNINDQDQPYSKDFKLNNSYALDPSHPLHGDGHQKESRYRGRLLDLMSPTANWWFYEVAAALLSLAGMVALLILLHRFDGKSLESWPLKISLNGLVAGLTILIRISCMVGVGSVISQTKWVWFYSSIGNKRKRRLEDLAIFEDASRGPFGSLLLLWRTKAGSLVCLGALLTIGSLAFDIFAQEVLSLRTHWVIVEDIEHGNNSLTYAKPMPRADFYSNYEHGESLTIQEAVPSMKAAIYNGIMTKDITPVPATCATSNRTWPVTPTLAVCGSCTQLKVTTSCSTPRDDPLGSCNYTLPDNTTATGGTGLRNALLLQLSPAPDWDAQDSTRYLYKFDLISNEEDTIGAQCELHLFIQAFGNVTVINGTQSKPTIRTWSEVLPIPEEKFSNADTIFTNIPDSFNIVSNSTYGIDWLALSGIRSQLAPILDGTAYMLDIGEYNYSSDFIEAIYGLSWTMDSLDEWIVNLATSMTNEIRQDGNTNLTSNPAAARYTGTAYTTEIYVHVRWSWLAFPALMVILAVTFLLASILQSRIRGIQAWKDDPLALLFMSVDERLMERTVGVVDKNKSLDDLVGTAEVVLQRKEEGDWKFQLAS